MACHNLGSPIIDGIFLVQKMCIYSSVMIITTVLITRGPVQWRGQLVMHHVYIMLLMLVSFFFCFLLFSCET